ncbi:MAG: hypothetical protein Q8R38_02170 [Candidatus Omnitrophota bacterium]|nr:hypothetical protein [Candidatus Omnitrophota bacterium]
MLKKARVWVGVTLLAVIVFNYIVIGLPLYRKMGSLENKIKAIMVEQVKSGQILKDSENNYIMDVLKKETIKLDRGIVILNCIAVSVSIIIISWIVFGLIVSRQDRIKL